ncbi:sterol desaturase family protein [Chondrocystis sp. NIES-4102]|nr:sterol desaturase family protein [Chondrocystis sp. NIES-4102]
MIYESLFLLNCFFVIIIIRYFLIAGGTYLVFYSVCKNFTHKRFLGSTFPNLKSIKTDIKLSILSALVFAACAVVIKLGYDLGITRLYTAFDQYGLWYLALSLIVSLILQDTCFYFIHRLSHHPWVFSWLHRGHHHAKTPNPWTSFALDPPEALIQGLFLVALVFILPLHLSVVACLLIIMTIWAMLNHVGLEFPTAFGGHWLGKWLIASTYHTVHHHKYTVNYGLYFTIWDKLLGTCDRDYDKTVKALRKARS